MISRPACMCVVRRRHPPEQTSISKSRIPRCKICVPVLSSNAAANSSQPLVKRSSSIPEKIKSPALEKLDPKLESPSRMSGYKKCITGSKYKNSTFKGVSNKEARKISRKSILECDVTAYDLIKNVAKTQPVSEIDDSDIDESLKDNAVAGINRIQKVNYENRAKPVTSPKVLSRSPINKNHSSAFKKSQSENCIYSESHSVLVGGQRIFTDNHMSKSPVLTGNMDSGDDELEDVNQNLANSNWRKISVSEESICIPDPDYDFSDSDDSTVINSNYMDPKFTYSPPTVRKSANELYYGLGCGSRELSKSMSSLQSDETFVPSININKPNVSDWIPELRGCDNFETSISDVASKVEEAEAKYREGLDVPCNTTLNTKQDSKGESSSDCSSSGGTLSSDYPTWTSSSSNELKSILKNKKIRSSVAKAVQDFSKVPDYQEELKESQKKKQVQFESGSRDANIIIGDNKETTGCNDHNSFNENIPTVINDIYETLDEPNSDKDTNGDMKEIQPNFKDYTKGACGFGNNGFEKDENDDITLNYNFSNSIKDSSNSILSSLPTEFHPTSLPKLPPCRSTSLEDLRNGNHQGRKKSAKGQTRSRTTLPKRRFSDLHLHLLLCPTASFCGDGSSGDDIPLTEATQRAHRSLPESPRELDEMPSFCFDFLDKNSKEKILSSRSVFYVPVEADAGGSIPTKTNIQEETTRAIIESPSTKENCNQFPPNSGNFEMLDTPAPENLLTPDSFDTTKDNVENEYEHLDPIYEELTEVSNSNKRLVSLESEPKSFFEGASKTDILSYLADAKERGLSTEGLSEDEKVIIEEEDEDEKVLSDEDVGEKGHIISNTNIGHKEVLLKIEEDTEREALESESTNVDTSKSPRISEVERNDSGVGTETSKPSRMKVLPVDWEEQLCADCDHQVEPMEDEKSGLLYSPLVCRKCEFRRSERKEIIIEFVDTEFKYGRDLRIIKEEFYKPMEIAGLLAKDQLFSIFLNLDELAAVNTKFYEKLQDALDIAMEHGDEDYTTVNIGKIFLETSSMLHAFETYCVKQASASVLLSHLEKERELLRIFLRVSQMENTLLRRMNLPAFLMVPVQRVTRYPLLLSRLHKVTPIHHKDRNALKEAQQKVELHLEHINQQTKGVGGTKIWRRISNISTSHRRLGKDIGSIKLRKMALEVLNWKQDEARFVIAGKLLLTQITDYPWNKKGRTIKFTSLHALLVAHGKPNSNYRPESMSSDNTVLFPRNTGIRNASLVFMKEKNGRFNIVREPLYLGNCVISCEAETSDVFEIQEYTTKEAFLLKGETKKDTKEWLRQLRYHAKDLGSWRKRRNALANIMINGMIRQ